MIPEWYEESLSKAFSSPSPKSSSGDVETQGDVGVQVGSSSVSTNDENEA